MAPIRLSHDDALAACHSREFADAVGGRDYASLDALLSHARDTWWLRVSVPGWLEAFAAHPQIGDAAAIEAKFASARPADQAFAARSSREQAAALASAALEAGGAAVFAELARLNAAYLKKFGHIFIVCASGRSAPEILEELRRRIEATPLQELRAAAAEQMAITELRLRAAVVAGEEGAAARAAEPAPAPASRAAARTEQLGRHLSATAPTPAPAGKSPITTHVLDTALGLPARDMAIELHVLAAEGGGAAAAAASPSPRGDGGGDGASDPRPWVRLAAARTDADGRVGDLLPAGSALEPGATYRVRFGTGAYLEEAARRFFGDSVGGSGGAALGGPLPPASFPFAIRSPAVPPFYPRADVEFTVPLDPQARRAHYHIPLLLSPFGFSTYRGS